MGKRKIGHTF